MRHATLASALLSLWLAGQAASQTTLIQGGCRDGNLGGLPLSTNGAPQLGNFGFSINYIAEGPTTFVYFIVSSCAQPLVNWNIGGEACTAGWSNPPATCPSVLGGSLYILDGSITAGNGATVSMPLPIPNYPPLVTLTQTAPLCFTFVGVDFANAVCTGFSDGLQLQFQP